MNPNRKSEKQSADNEIVIKPQRGGQELALASRADILFYGGQAGAGKSWMLCADPLRHKDNPNYRAICFRRTEGEIEGENGLWETSMSFYPQLGGFPISSKLRWQFQKGMSLRFSGMQHENDKLKHQGKGYSFIGFDEVTHFTKGQFWYLQSRNRSMSGVRGRTRATCNPDPDSWVAEFIAWWINQETGYPIPERSGVLRWFIRDGDEIVWGNSPMELAKKYDPKLYPPRSVTFIPGSIHDNKILLEKDPAYLTTLMSLPLVERERLLGGNWLIRATAGTVFKRRWFKIVDAAPADAYRVRYWDLAGTEKEDKNDPDFTCGVRMSRDQHGMIFVEDAEFLQESPGAVEKAIKQTAADDGVNVPVGFGKDPGQAGKAQVRYLVGRLDKYNARGFKETGDKVRRAGPFSAQAEVGNVCLVRGKWNEQYLRTLEAFPTKGVHDDAVDASSGAYNMILVGGSDGPIGY